MERKVRIAQIVESVKQASSLGLGVNEEKLIAECCLDWGAGERYVKEYLKQLETLGRIIRKDGEIWDYQTFKDSERILNEEDKTLTDDTG